MTDPLDNTPNECVPHCVPSVSRTHSVTPASECVPRPPTPTEGDTLAGHGRPCPTTVSRPWFQPHQITWTYPDPKHPSSVDFPYATRARSNPCPTCGAPTRANCVTRRGETYSGVHGARLREASR